MPRHTTDIEQASQAPYNFVPLPSKVFTPAGASVDFSKFHADRFHGELELEVETLSWLYARSGFELKDGNAPPDDPQKAIWTTDGAAYREHFHHGDPSRPVFPGSGLRGALRQLIAALSDGKLRTDEGRQLVYRAVGADADSRFGQWYRRRFVGPNTRARPGHAKGEIAPNPTGFPQDMEYPVLRHDANNAWKRYSVHGGYLYREGRDWFIRPAVEHQGSSMVAISTLKLPRELNDWQHRLGVHRVLVVPGTVEQKMHRGGQLGLTYARTESCRIAGARDVPRPNECVAHLVLTATLLNKEKRPAKTMHRAIYEPDRSKASISVPREMRELYEEDQAISRAKGREGRLLKPANGDAKCEECPCFYMMAESGLVFFGGTLFFRLPYVERTGAVLPPQREDDLVDHLFGSARGSAGVGSGRRGRLRIEDLRLHPDFKGNPFVEDGSPAGGYVSPAPLLSPKPTSVQHYLVQPSPDPRELRHYDDRFGETAARGFKMYWHKRPTGNAPAVARSSVEPWTQIPSEKRGARTIIRPVRDGVRFRSRIAFENLTALELGALLVATELPPGCRHQLGMGRPLGFGSVHVTIPPGGLRFVDPQARFSSFMTKDGDLNTGWLGAEESRTRADDCRRHFYEALADHRGPAKRGDPASPSDRFWSHERMRMLAALLSWDAAPPLERTRSVGVDGPSGQQWKRRWLLPNPIEVTEASSREGVQSGRRQVGRKDDRPARPKTLEERWVSARLSLNGTTLIATQQLRIATVATSEAQELLAALRPKDRADLLQGKDLRNFHVTVRRIESGSYTIVAIASAASGPGV